MKYDYIVNPLTNRKCSIHSRNGKKILNQYLIQNGGEYGAPHFIEKLTIPGDSTVYELVFFNPEFRETWDQKYHKIVQNDKKVIINKDSKDLNRWRDNWDITKLLNKEQFRLGHSGAQVEFFVAMLFKKEQGGIYRPVAVCESEILDETVAISFVKVHPEFIGRHLCKPLVSYMIKNLKKLGHNDLAIENESHTKGGIPACYCYYRAGIENGYTMHYTNFKDEENPSFDFRPMTEEDCKLKPIPREYYYKI